MVWLIAKLIGLAHRPCYSNAPCPLRTTLVLPRIPVGQFFNHRKLLLRWIAHPACGTMLSCGWGSSELPYSSARHVSCAIFMGRPIVSAFRQKKKKKKRQLPQASIGKLLKFCTHHSSYIMKSFLSYTCYSATYSVRQHLLHPKRFIGTPLG
jgi:hypothetical protein